MFSDSATNPHPYRFPWLQQGAQPCFLCMILLLAATCLSSSAWAQDPPLCADTDGDGAVECVGGCDPGGASCDCDDGNPAVNPDATELCNAVDDNCDGAIDDGYDVGDSCEVTETGNPCVVGGTKQCTADGAGTFCEHGPIPDPRPEVLGEATCHDGFDNDCNGFADGVDVSCQTINEVGLCNGFDDDGDTFIDEDFPLLGLPCEVGTGFCARSGNYACADDQIGVVCNALPGVPSSEDNPGKQACTDGIDNDCDTYTDLSDAGCQTAELCDGVDNNGDSLIDEGFDIGADCSVGVGACESAGATVCDVAGTGIRCNAVSLAPMAEGPIGVTCSDGIDNDCDGKSDLDDADCVAATLDVACSLIPQKGKSGKGKGGEPGTDCEGKFKVEVTTSGDPSHLSAELVTLDVDGNWLGSLVVEDGDIAHLASRVDPTDYKLQHQGAFAHAFAPIPMLIATYEDGKVLKQAYCTTIPYLDVLQPSGTVVSASEGDVTEVVVALPQVDPKTIAVKVDGIDLLSALGLDPASAFPGGPYDGEVKDGGGEVLFTVSELAVSSAPLGESSTNSMTMRLEGLGGGGHIVYVDANPLVVEDPVSAACHVDDVLDTGTVAVFEIIIDEPAAGSVTDAVPTPVTGKVLHGRPIERFTINGWPFVAGTDFVPDFTPGDGENTADTYEVPFNLALEQTNVSLPPQLGTFDRGQNAALGGAHDDLGNLTFATNLFTIGDTLEPGGKPSSLGTAGGSAFFAAASSISLENALILGISAEGFSNLFNSTCAKASDLIDCKISDALAAKAFPSKKVDVPLACDPEVTLDIVSPEDVSLGAIACTPTLGMDRIDLGIALPAINVMDATAKGSCCTGCPICLSRVTIDADADLAINNFSLNLPLDLDLFLNGGTVETSEVINGGSVAVGDINCHECDVDCVVSWIGCAFGGLVGCIVSVVVDIVDLDSGLISNIITGTTFEKDILEAIANSGNNVFEFEGIELDADQIAAISKLEAAQELVDGSITPDGFIGRLTASFDVPDPLQDLDIWPEAPATPAPAPTFPVSGADDAFLVIADEVFSLLYAGLTARGAFQTECAATSGTFLDLLPADCDTLDGNLEKGRCKGAKGDVDCEDLPLLQQAACNDARQDLIDNGITTSTPLLACGKLGLGPRLVLQDTNPADAVVDAKLRMNDYRVNLVLDRNATGSLDNNLAVTSNCFGPGANITDDCKWGAGCFDVDVAVDLTLDTSGENPELLAEINGLRGTPVAVQCEGGALFGDKGLLGDVATEVPLTALEDSLNALTPEFRTLGLDLGGTVDFQDARLLTVETLSEPDCPDCREYIGVTGDLAVPGDLEPTPCP